MIPPLETQEIRVFLVDPERTDAGALAQAHLGWLAREEHERYQRLVFAEKKHEFLVTRVLVRRVLAGLLGRSPVGLAFDLGPYGRPELRGPPSDGAGRLRFNLSNTRGLVACAVAWNRDVGVDVEHVDRRTETTAIADRFFSPAEVEGLMRLDPSEQRRRFFELWTLKEAYIKARGLGLAIPLESFSFSLGHAGPPTIAFAESLHDDPHSWRFEQSFPCPTHAMALAVRVEPQEPVSIALQWLDLAP